MWKAKTKATLELYLQSCTTNEECKINFSPHSGWFIEADCGCLASAYLMRLPNNLERPAECV